MRKVQVISGDLTQTPADALITAVNPGGLWFGGIDGAIKRVAGELFHNQARRALPLSQGATVVARSNGQAHRGRFRDVVFVIDGLEGPLSKVIFNGLVAASNACFQSVTLPTIRMGVTLGVVEKSKEEAVSGMAGGVVRFFKENPETSIENVTFVVYNDPGTEVLLNKALEETFAACS